MGLQTGLTQIGFFDAFPKKAYIFFAVVTSYSKKNDIHHFNYILQGCINVVDKNCC